MHLLGTLSAVRFFTDVGHSLREGFYMFWDTLWALVLGFTLSGAVQAFASRQEMQRRLGDHRPASVVRASLYGMVSSSCSYAASAMARSLFARGADFLAAMVFMFASTNLVVELGIVLVVLIGWQFIAAELVGGIIMIVLLVVAGGLWFRGRALTEARSAVEGGQNARHGDDADSDRQRQPWGLRVRSRAGWADAAGYTMSDLTMLRKEMVIGFTVAGFLATLVPTQVWNDVFVHGHGFWTSLENVIVGPFVAIISFVCSIGNVPLAAALWKGGISFGGVVSFIFADLITLPLLLIYRKQYGRRMTLRMLGVFWSVMSAAGLITEYLFKALGWLPSGRPTVVAGDTLRFNYTTVLDMIALAAFAGLYWLYRNRERLGGASGYAKDPVCGMQVETRHAPASTEHGGHRLYFCSEHCQERFEKNPERYRAGAPSDQDGATGAVDPICGMSVDPRQAPAHRRVGGEEIFFCGLGCAEEFDRRQTPADTSATSRPGATHRRHPT
ncbi:MAG TPA: permease [Acidimicrobiales bacterium]